MEHPFGSDFRWESLSEEERQAMRAIMHAHLTEPDLSPDVLNHSDQPLQWLQEDGHPIRLAMAVNPNTPAPVLHQIASCGVTSILERVAENPRAHHSTLSALATHSHPDVRAAVAENSNAPLAVIKLLAADEHPDVRYRLAENHNSPAEILQLLAEDHNPYVACRAQRTLVRLQSNNLPADSLLSGSSPVHHGAGDV